jgi:hypothetical protein
MVVARSLLTAANGAMTVGRSITRKREEKREREKRGERKGCATV